MHVLTGDLRQPVDLALERVVQAAVGVAEVDRRVPHLQVEILAALGIVQIGAFAALEELGLRIVNRVTVRTVNRFELQQLGGVQFMLGVTLWAGAGRQPKRGTHGQCLC